MPEGAPVRLADLTTLRLGGPARHAVVAATEQQLCDAVARADADGVPVLLVAGGSNLVVADEGFDGTVVRVATTGIRAEHRAGRVRLTVAAGEDWDAVVAHAVAAGWSGVEALSGIPGATGATPIQNVGAYGQEVAGTTVAVRAWRRSTRTLHTLGPQDCGFGYRTSRFKADPGEWVILSATFELGTGGSGSPVRYAELARRLGVSLGEVAPVASVREAVLALRAGKGMVLDAGDHDTWSAGSFFTNPVLAPGQAARLPDGAPRFEQPDGSVKTSAAWLIEHAGFARGHGLDRPGARVGLSTKHTLALTNRGGGTTAELLELAREVRDGVEDRFGVRLVNEPVLVGCRL